MYGTVADWIDYAAARGLTVADDAASAQALTRASDYIRTRYVIPRAPEYDADSPEVVEGSYIAARYELSNPGFFDAIIAPGDRVKSAGAGPAKVEFFDDPMRFGMDAAKIVSTIDALFTKASHYPVVFTA